MSNLLEPLGIDAVIPEMAGGCTVFDWSGRLFCRNVCTQSVEGAAKKMLMLPGKASPATCVEPQLIVNGGTFAQFFSGHKVLLPSLALTEGQVIWVVENQSGLLNLKGYSNLFLLQKGDSGDYFVVDARFLNVLFESPRCFCVSILV